MSIVVEQLKQWQPKSILELGAYKMPLTDFSDTMDFMSLPGISRYPTILHDATEIPWPVENKKYDVFVALQVWEHLGERQPEIFKEVIRIADKAILSFPYKWKCKKPEDASHANIDEKVISNWTLNVEPVLVRKKKGKIIYFWDF